MEISAYHPFQSAEAKAEYLAYCDENDKEWPVVSESRMVDTSHGQTFVKISGAAGAPPLVLLPGMNTSSVTWGWIPILADLSECFRTYAVDNIYDYGRSVNTRTYEGPDDFVNWLDELFSVLGFGNNINLMGLSLGGWLTNLYTLRFPNRLAKVVTLAPAGTAVPMSFQCMMHATPMNILPFPYFAKKFLYWLGNYGMQKEDADRMLVERTVDHIMMNQKCFISKQLIFPTVFEDKELKSIKTPMLYLIAENEKLYSSQKAIQRLNQVAPNIKAKIVPNASHYSIMEEMGSDVLEFLIQS